MKEKNTDGQSELTVYYEALEIWDRRKVYKFHVLTCRAGKLALCQNHSFWYELPKSCTHLAA